MNVKKFRTFSAPAAQLMEQLSAEELRHHLSALQQVTEAALANLSVSELLRELLKRLQSVLSVDSATVLLLDRSRSTLQVRASEGLEEEVEQHVEIPLGGGVVGAAAMDRAPVIVDRVSDFDPISPLLRKLSSLMIAPLIADGDLIGALHVGSLKPREFRDAELILLQVAADRIALALRNAILYDTAQRNLEDRDRVEGALAESEARYRILAETAADAIVTIDSESTIVTANPAAGEAFGYSVEELVGRSFCELMPERFRSLHEAGLKRYLETGERRLPWRKLELPGLRRDGVEVLLDVSFAEREEGGTRYFTGTMRDITEQKRTERVLAAQFATTRVLAENESVDEAIPGILEGVAKALEWEAGIFWTWDGRNEVVRSVNFWSDPSIDVEAFQKASTDITLASGVGLPGRVWETRKPRWIADLTQESNFPRLRAALAAGLCTAFAFPVCVGSDCLGVMEFYTRQASDVDARLLETMDALGADIGQFIRRREAEDRLEVQEELQRFFGEVSAKLAASALDFDATLKRLARLAVPVLADGCSVNMRSEDGSVMRLEVVHEEPEKELLVQQLAHYSVKDGSRSPVGQVMDTGESVLIPEIDDEFLRLAVHDETHADLIRRSGIQSMMIVPLRARGRTLGTVTLLSTDPGRRYDQSDLMPAEEFARRAAYAVDNARLYRQSQEANRAKADFLATVSHELRTPLNVVIGYGDLLKMGIVESDPAKAAQYAERIGVSARHLSQLIEEVLAFSRIESGREKVSAEPVQLKQLLTELRVSAEPLAAEKNLRHQISSIDSSVEMYTDAAKIRQILLNLVGNSIKFTEQGEVRVDAEIVGDNVVFVVSDTGIGIAADKIGKVFEPFWQVEQGTTRKAGGTGLGLTVTKRFAELLGGGIELSSAVGEGTTVRVRLPLHYRGPRLNDPVAAEDRDSGVRGWRAGRRRFDEAS